MDVLDAIQSRRAYRALEPIAISDEIIQDLAKSAQLAASCFNKQPWRFVFVRSPEMLSQLHSALSRNNEWVEAASLLIVVYTEKGLDCLLPGREYFLFDTGMATATLILRATELGLVAHPIAGFDDTKVKQILGISEAMTAITLIVVGKHADKPTHLMTEKQVSTEKQRPPRVALEEFVAIK